MSEPVITIENLGKKYRLTHQAGRPRYTALRDVMAEKAKSLFRRRPTRASNGLARTEDFWALKDVSLEIQQGEVVGIIGRNGAGKSTLLKILSRITEPTTGRVRIRGRVASLLEVGTGFHPELTGRENIFLNGAILGMTRAEIRRKFDEIVAFAEVEKFLDTPVKHYSSGMYVRLAFAVAAHLEPEILVVDEVLAVGDAQFQKKCLNKMDDVSRGGRTVLFVSHNMSAMLQLTSRAVLLTGGELAYQGPTHFVIERYTQTGTGVGDTFFNVEHKPRKYTGTGSARIVSVRFDRSLPLFTAEEDFTFVVRIRAFQNIPRLRASMTIFAGDGSPVGNCFGEESLSLSEGDVFDVQVTLPCPNLAPGQYFCALALGKGDHITGPVEFDVVSDTLQFEVAPQEGDGGTVSCWTPGWGHVRFEHLRQSVCTCSRTLIPG
jgi:lipopolysaccharide transport system ATP-binding protein